MTARHQPTRKNVTRKASHQKLVIKKVQTKSTNSRRARNARCDRWKRNKQDLANETWYTTYLGAKRNRNILNLKETLVESDNGSCKRSQNGSKSGRAATGLGQKTVVKQETRVTRRKRMTKEKIIAAILFIENEERKPTQVSGRQDSEESEYLAPGSEEALTVFSPYFQRQRERIFLAGGIQDDYFARKALLEYDPVNSVYIPCSAMKVSRFNHGIVQVEKEIYFVGDNSGLFEQLRSVESYSVERNEWSSHASMHESRDEFSLVNCGRFLYAIGGHDGIHDL